MASEQLKIVFKYETLNSELTMRRVAEIFASKGITSPKFELAGRKLNTPRLLSELKAASKRIFNIIGPGYEFVVASLPKFKIDFLTIRSTSEANVIWDDWISGFFEDVNFIMAWVVDVDYDHWQNAADPQEYEVLGKSYAHLPLKPNGLPYPLNRMEIDTSHNPGRWQFGAGYIETVGATMWLSPLFWELTGADRTKLEQVSWLKIFKPTPNIIRVQAADACFKTGEGELGERQFSLRSLLFPHLISDQRSAVHPPSASTRH